MEPYRSFFQFMEAVQLILALRLDCHVDLGGSDRSCYGSASADGGTWRQIEKEKGGYDMDRVHFVGRLNRGDFLRLLQVPTVHIHLPRPFILSWSPFGSNGSEMLPRGFGDVSCGGGRGGWGMAYWRTSAIQ